MDSQPDDVLEFRDGVFASFGAVLSRAIQVGADTVIDDGLGDTIILQGVQGSILSVDDFRFV